MRATVMIQPAGGGRPWAPAEATHWLGQRPARGKELAPGPRRSAGPGEPHCYRCREKPGEFVFK